MVRKVSKATLLLGTLNNSIAFDELIKRRGAHATCLPGHDGEAGPIVRMFAHAAVISPEREHVCALAFFEQG